jgi:hypothetical protein
VPRSPAADYGSLSGRPQLIVGKEAMMAAHDESMSVL